MKPDLFEVVRTIQAQALGTGLHNFDSDGKDERGNALLLFCYTQALIRIFFKWSVSKSLNLFIPSK